MKTIKFIASVVLGLVVLGSVSAHATATLNINLTTYVETATTNADGSITYARSSVSIKNADLLAKAADILGITVPADAKLALSTSADSLNGINVGDVLVCDAKGSILWDLKDFSNAIGDLEFEVDFEAVLDQTQNATKSTAHSFRGIGQLNFRGTKFETEAVARVVGPKGDISPIPQKQYIIEIHDAQMSAVAAVGKFGAQLSTGSGVITGAGQVYNDNGVTQVFQPINGTINTAFANIPGAFFDFNN